MPRLPQLVKLVLPSVLSPISLCRVGSRDCISSEENASDKSDCCNNFLKPFLQVLISKVQTSISYIFIYLQKYCLYSLIPWDNQEEPNVLPMLHKPIFSQFQGKERDNSTNILTELQQKPGAVQINEPHQHLPKGPPSQNTVCARIQSKTSGENITHIKNQRKQEEVFVVKYGDHATEECYLGGL